MAPVSSSVKYKNLPAGSATTPVAVLAVGTETAAPRAPVLRSMGKPKTCCGLLLGKLLPATYRNSALVCGTTMVVEDDPPQVAISSKKNESKRSCAMTKRRFFFISHSPE